LKTFLLGILILISILGIYMGVPPLPLLIGYGLLAVIPLVIIIVKKDLVVGMLLWFVLILFTLFT